MNIRLEFTPEQLDWVIRGLSAWRSDYEGVDDVPWEQIVDLQEYCQVLLDRYMRNEGSRKC
jgi:hypothetical protein